MDDPKYKIRKGSLFNRRMLDARIWRERNDRVCQQAFELLVVHQIKCFHVFLPIKRNKEVDLWEVIFRSSESQRQVVVSATDFETETMRHFSYTQELTFEEDQFGIPTPTSGDLADLNKLELIFVPLLAGDKKGNRIGYGMGYYDRLLAQMPKNLLKVGLTLNPLFDHFRFAEPHDIALDYCITPHEVVKCQ